VCVHKTSLGARQSHKGHWQGQVKYTEEGNGQSRILQYGHKITKWP
jgi:hypothetical protein